MFLRLVQGCIYAAEDVLSSIPEEMPAGNADTGSHMFFFMELRGCDMPSQFFSEVRGLAKIHPGKDDNEFFATEADERLTGLQHLADAGSKAPEDAVSVIVPIGIVEALEMVDVEHDEGIRELLVDSVRAGTVYELVEARAVEASRQLVRRSTDIRVVYFLLEIFCLNLHVFLPPNLLLEDAEDEDEEEKDSDRHQVDMHVEEMEIGVHPVKGDGHDKRRAWEERPESIIISMIPFESFKSQDDRLENREGEEHQGEQLAHRMKVEYLSKHGEGEQGKVAGKDERDNFLLLLPLKDRINDEVARHCQEAHHEALDIPPEPGISRKQVLHVEEADDAQDEEGKERDGSKIYLPADVLLHPEEIHDDEHADGKGQGSNIQPVEEEYSLSLSHLGIQIEIIEPSEHGMDRAVKLHHEPVLVVVRNREWNKMPAGTIVPKHVLVLAIAVNRDAVHQHFDRLASC